MTAMIKLDPVSSKKVMETSMFQQKNNSILIGRTTGHFNFPSLWSKSQSRETVFTPGRRRVTKCKRGLKEKVAAGVGGKTHYRKMELINVALSIRISCGLIIAVYCKCCSRSRYLNTGSVEINSLLSRCPILHRLRIRPGHCRATLAPLSHLALMRWRYV